MKCNTCLAGKPAPGLAFFTLSLISTKQRRSFPIAVEQVVRTPEERAAASAKAQAKTKPTASITPKRKGGRPLGSSTKAKTAVALSPELRPIQVLLLALLRLIGTLFGWCSWPQQGLYAFRAADTCRARTPCCG